METIQFTFISVFNQLDAQSLFNNKFYFMPLHVSSTFAHHQEAKIALHSLWYHHTYRWPSHFMPLHVSSTCANHQEVKIALHSLWYHHTYRWPSHFISLHVSSTCAHHQEVKIALLVHETATYRCDDTRGCVMQF